VIASDYTSLPTNTIVWKEEPIKTDPKISFLLVRQTAQSFGPSSYSISLMVGMKRRDSSMNSMTRENSLCQKLQFDNVQDLYLTTETIPSASPTTRLYHTKYVHFLNTTQIIEIPSRYDYFEAGINLWWSANDLKYFRQDYLLTCSSSH
jgi:hypothetical protein